MAPDSQTPTYAALKLYIDNWRWQGVPFYLRSGKALARKTSEIVIQFQSPPHLMFDLPAEHEFTPNILSICIQPDEGIHLKFETKVPGFRSGDPLGGHGVSLPLFLWRYLPDAYERLLLDALHGDAALFARGDEIEMAWKLIDPVLEGWARPRRRRWGPMNGAAGGRPRRTNYSRVRTTYGRWVASIARLMDDPVPSIWTRTNTDIHGGEKRSQMAVYVNPCLP